MWIPLVFITKTQPLVDHEFSRLGTIDSLVVRHNYYLEESRFHGSADRIDYKGHSYSHQPPLLSTLQAPVFWVLHQAGLNLWNSAPFDLAYLLFTWLTSGAALALTVVVLDATFRLGGVSASLSAFSAIALTLGTWLFPYALVVNNHVVSGLLVACLAWTLLKIEKGYLSAGLMVTVGAIIGLLITVEVIPAVSFVPITIACLVMRPDVRSRPYVAALAGGAAVPLLAHAIINIGQTGDVIPGGFHSELFVYEGSKFDSTTLSGNMNHPSVREFADYAWRALFSEKGYFSYAPVPLVGALAGFLGWRWWSRYRMLHVVMLGGAVLSLFASLLMTNNFGGFAAGFRHATYLAPAFVVLLLPILSTEARSARIVARVTLAAAVCSALFLAIVTAPRPWYPYTFPPESPVLKSWDTYFPVVSHVLRRVNGDVDEFGKPITAVK